MSRACNSACMASYCNTLMGYSCRRVNKSQGGRMLRLIVELICQWWCQYGVAGIDFEYRCDGRPTCRNRCPEVHPTGTIVEALL